MSFIAYLKRLLVGQKAVYNLSRNHEFNSFYFIGFKKSAAAIDFITCVKADHLTERQIVMLRDQFFSAVQAVSYGFGLKPLARNPNGLLTFVFQHGCSDDIASFIQKQTRAASFQKSAVTVAWAIDVPRKKIFTHNNPVSILPPILIAKQFVFPGLSFLNDTLVQYEQEVTSGRIADEQGSQGRKAADAEGSGMAMELGRDFAAQLGTMQATIGEIFNIVSNMADQPKYSFPNAQKVQVFERIDTYIENQAGADEALLRQSLAELKQHISTLQQQHPQATTEAEASAIIEAEFMAIRQRHPQKWQNLLQLKRWLNGLKEGSFSLGEHFAQESPWGKAIVGFLQGFTDDIK